MKFGDEFVLEFGDKFGESPNLGTNMSPNLGTNLVNPQIWGQICPQICPQKAREHISLPVMLSLVGPAAYSQASKEETGRDEKEAFVTAAEPFKPIVKNGVPLKEQKEELTKDPTGKNG